MRTCKHLRFIEGICIWKRSIWYLATVWRQTPAFHYQVSYRTWIQNDISGISNLEYIDIWENVSGRVDMMLGHCSVRKSSDQYQASYQSWMYHDVSGILKLAVIYENIHPKIHCGIMYLGGSIWYLATAWCHTPPVHYRVPYRSRIRHDTSGKL